MKLKRRNEQDAHVKWVSIGSGVSPTGNFAGREVASVHVVGMIQYLTSDKSDQMRSDAQLCSSGESSVSPPPG